MKRYETSGKFDIGEKVRVIATGKVAYVVQYTSCDDGCCEGFLLDDDKFYWHEPYNLESLDEE